MNLARLDLDLLFWKFCRKLLKRLRIHSKQKRSVLRSIHPIFHRVWKKTNPFLAWKRAGRRSSAESTVFVNVDLIRGSAAGVVSRWLNMTSYTGFHSQLTSIMEALTKAAVAEICELVDDSYAVLRLEITRSHKENEALRRKLELIESIIARGHRGSAAVLEEEEGCERLLDFTPGEFSGFRSSAGQWCFERETSCV